MTEPLIEISRDQALALVAQAAALMDAQPASPQEELIELTVEQVVAGLEKLSPDMRVNMNPEQAVAIRRHMIWHRGGIHSRAGLHMLFPGLGRFKGK